METLAEQPLIEIDLTDPPEEYWLRPALYVVQGVHQTILESVEGQETQKVFVVTGDEQLPNVDLPGRKQSHVRLARSAVYETFTRTRYKRWLGSLALRETDEEAKKVEVADGTNLLDKIRQAKAGSAEALQLVGCNVATAVAEACFKDRHITKVTTQRNEAGELIQFGQSMRSVYANALTMRNGRHEKLQEITEIEALNGHRIEDALRSGTLKDHYFVVPSIVPCGVPEDDLGHKGDGYFTDSLTFVVQATTEQPSGEVTTESAFMAGVTADVCDNFEDRITSRHDIRALTKIYKRLGFDAPGTAAEFLNSGLYIPKHLMSNGVVDFMRWCDEATDEVLENKFTRKSEDYIAVIEESKRREASLESTRQKVTKDLLSAAETLETPMDAVRLMWQLVKKHAVEASYNNERIDPSVFGNDAAYLIGRIRQHIAVGEHIIAQQLMPKAQEKAVVSGCGGGAPVVSSGEAGSQAEEQASQGSDKYGSLQFSCPHCRRTNNRPTGKLLKNCQHCSKDVTCK